MQHERTAIESFCSLQGHMDPSVLVQILYEAPLLTATASPLQTKQHCACTQFACHVYAPRIEFSAQPSLIYCINAGGSLCVHALDSDTTPACAQAGSLLVVGEELCALITADAACGGAAH